MSASTPSKPAEAKDYFRVRIHSSRSNEKIYRQVYESIQKALSEGKTNIEVTFCDWKENAILRAQLEKCKEQRDGFRKNYWSFMPVDLPYAAEIINSNDQELEDIAAKMMGDPVGKKEGEG